MAKGYTLEDVVIGVSMEDKVFIISCKDMEQEHKAQTVLNAIGKLKSNDGIGLHEGDIDEYIVNSDRGKITASRIYKATLDCLIDYKAIGSQYIQPLELDRVEIRLKDIVLINTLSNNGSHIADWYNYIDKIILLNPQYELQRAIGEKWVLVRNKINRTGSLSIQQVYQILMECRRKEQLIDETQEWFQKTFNFGSA